MTLVVHGLHCHNDRWKPSPLGGDSCGSGAVVLSFEKKEDFVENYRKGSHTVHDIKYHFVWITKYRYNVMVGDIAIRTRSIIPETCAWPMTSRY